MPRPDRQRCLRIVSLVGLLIGPGPVLADAEDSRLAVIERFTTAPEQEPDGALVLEVTLNGVPMGPMDFVAMRGELRMPPETARALRLGSTATGLVDFSMISGATFAVDRQRGTVTIQVPPDALGVVTLRPIDGQSAPPLSPEAKGLFVNYDVNARRTDEGGASRGSYGGLASLQAFGPDLVASSGWSYDSLGTRAPVRLDTTLTWRPADRDLALSAGDLISAPGIVARPFRYSGLAFGTDHSAEPGWSPLPLPSVTGTAQPTSSIDLYVNGLRAAQMPTPGGPFTVVLPQGSFTGNTHLVVTDITGRVVDIPFSSPRFNLDLIKSGLSLWSVGVGAPRFNWGADSGTWLPQSFGYGSVRRGLRDDLTVGLHAEAGPGVWQAEGEIQSLVGTALGVRAAAAASHSEFGSGEYFSSDAILSLPGNVSVDAGGGTATGHYDDAVSISGTRFDQRNGLTNTYSQPLQQALDLRITWEPRDRLTLSAAYDRLRYRGSRATPFASISATRSLGSSATLFVTATRDYSGSSGTSVLAGLSMLFGRGVNGSVSAGQENGESATQALLARPLGEDKGDIGWQLSAQNAAAGHYLNGEVELRSGHGIPAVGLTEFGGATQAYIRATGSAGIAAGHPFVGDPIEGGVIVADVGQPGVPLSINGYEATRSGSDGKALIPAFVAGAPQRVEIAEDHVPLDLIPSTTQQIVTVRQGSGTVAVFAMRSAEHGAIVTLRVDGAPPPLGSSVRVGEIDIPVDRDGRLWVPQLGVDATLDVELPDGRRCSVATGFNGHGGPGVVLGPYDCRADR